MDNKQLEILRNGSIPEKNVLASHIYRFMDSFLSSIPEVFTELVQLMFSGKNYTFSSANALVTLERYISKESNIKNLKKLENVLKKEYSLWIKREGTKSPELIHHAKHLIRAIDQKINSVKAKPNGLKKHVIVPRDRGKLRISRVLSV